MQFGMLRYVEEFTGRQQVPLDWEHRVVSAFVCSGGACIPGVTDSRVPAGYVAERMTPAAAKRYFPRFGFGADLPYYRAAGGDFAEMVRSAARWEDWHRDRDYYSRKLVLCYAVIITAPRDAFAALAAPEPPIPPFAEWLAVAAGRGSRAGWNCFATDSELTLECAGQIDIALPRGVQKLLRERWGLEWAGFYVPPHSAQRPPSIGPACRAARSQQCLDRARASAAAPRAEARAYQVAVSEKYHRPEAWEGRALPPDVVGAAVSEAERYHFCAHYHWGGAWESALVLPQAAEL